MFLDLFGIARVRYAFVADLLRLSDGVILWDLSFTKSVQDWELESLSIFLDLLFLTSVRGDGVDKICWRLPEGAQFSFGSYFRSMSGSIAVSFSWKLIWKSCVPSRVAFFFFRALGKILTVDNLRRRHIVVLDWCCICKCNGESVDHLLLQCPIAYEMCSMLFGVIWYILGYA
jgi:hypothetical protein